MPGREDLGGGLLVEERRNKYRCTTTYSKKVGRKKLGGEKTTEFSKTTLQGGSY